MNSIDNTVKIVTDSSVNMPFELRRENDISVVPLRAIFGTQEYRDEIDLTNQQFYEMLPTAKEHPKTSQPSVGDFLQVYQPLLEAGREIVSLHMPSKLSGTYSSACAAKAELENQFKKALPLTIIDTPWLSMALGLLVIAAAQAAQAGKSRDEVIATVNALIPQLNLLFVLDTLEYLKRGGRIGGARALLGSLLNVKPMLEICDGQVEPFEQPRSRSKALRRLLETLEERADHHPNLHVSVLHAQALDEAVALEKEIRERFDCAELYLAEIGPVIGIHAGPGTVGIAFYST
jgi:DegV family protein with EDD domain